MNGLVLLDKPSGMTSFTAASIMKRAYGTKRVGHTGTLDPLATGVLPVLIGRATRLCGYVLESDKRYIAKIKLGITTDTLDVTGKLLTETECAVSEEEARQVISSFVGEISQIPPMYSAIRVDGRRLYELARSGVEVERAERRVRINSIELLSFGGNEMTVEVDCSKGTYIRTLADDIGRKLGCGGAVSELRRVMTAGFDISMCTDPDTVKLEPERYLLSADAAVPQFGKLYITKGQAVRFCNGGALMRERITLPEADGRIFRVYDGDEFLGLGELDESGNELGVKCVITERSIR